MELEAGDDAALATTVGFLIKALRTLGHRGDPDAANRLAAQTWLALRDEHPRQAERLNGAMHYLVRLPQGPESEYRSSPTNQEDR